MHSLGIYTLHLLIRKIKNVPTPNEIKIHIFAHQNNLRAFLLSRFLSRCDYISGCLNQIRVEMPLPCLVWMEIPNRCYCPFFVQLHRVTTARHICMFSPPLTGNFWKSHQSIPVACALQKVGWLDSCGNDFQSTSSWHGWMVKMLTGNHQQLNRSTKKGLGVTLESPSTSTRSWLKS